MWRTKGSLAATKSVCTGSLDCVARRGLCGRRGRLMAPRILPHVKRGIMSRDVPVAFLINSYKPTATFFSALHRLGIKTFAAILVACLQACSGIHAEILLEPFFAACKAAAGRDIKEYCREYCW